MLILESLHCTRYLGIKRKTEKVHRAFMGAELSTVVAYNEGRLSFQFQ